MYKRLAVLQTGSFILSLIAVSGCTLAPLSGDVTARSNGKMNVNAETGAYLYTDTFFLRSGLGVTDAVDLGILAEAGGFGDQVGLWAKFAVLNNPEKFAVALTGSAGGSGHGRYWSTGAIASYKMNAFEPYLSTRYNSVYVNESEQSSDLDFLRDTDKHYMQSTLGMNYWFNQRIGLSINANAFDWDGFIYGAGLMFRF